MRWLCGFLIAAWVLVASGIGYTTNPVWIMPNTPDNMSIHIFVRTPEQIRIQGVELGMRPSTSGLALIRIKANGGIICDLYLPILTIRTMKTWRHEFRHCHEPSFHGSVVWERLDTVRNLSEGLVSP